MIFFNNEKITITAVWWGISGKYCTGISDWEKVLFISGFEITYWTPTHRCGECTQLVRGKWSLKLLKLPASSFCLYLKWIAALFSQLLGGFTIKMKIRKNVSLKHYVSVFYTQAYSSASVFGPSWWINFL